MTDDIAERIRCAENDYRDLLAKAILDSKNTHPTPRKELLAKMVRVYRDVVLDEDMYDFLLLGPEFAIIDKIRRLELEKEFVRGLTLIQWGRYGLTPSDIVPAKTMDELIDEEEVEKEVFLCQRTFNTETKTLNMSKLRQTDMSTNCRVIMPGPDHWRRRRH